MVDANAASVSASLRDEFELAQDGSAGSAEVDWFADHLAGHAGPMLDASCGIGRLLVPLVDRGVAVHGVETSASALALCTSRLGERAASTPLVRQSPAELNLPFRYTAACFADGRFQQIMDPTLAFAALARVAAHLVAPGTLLLDMIIPGAARYAPGAPLIEVRTVANANGETLVERSETLVDIEGRRISKRSRFEKRVGPRIVARDDERGAMTWYSENELSALLRDAGFKAVEIVASPRPNAGDELRYALVATVAPAASSH
jgi:SAM-dependent methyltransferase